MLWLMLTLIVLAGVGFIAWPVLRRRTLAGGASTSIYVAQLDEIERECASGLISDEDGRMARTEIGRRLLSAEAGSASTREAELTQTDRTMFITMAAVVAIGSALIYSVVGSPGSPAATGGMLTQTVSGATPGASTSVGPVSDMIDQLEARLTTQPADVEGWRMLGWSKFRTDDYAGAAAAYARAVQLAPEDAETQSGYGEALTRAAGGRVTAEAAQALEAAIRFDPKDARARFLLGLKKEQEGHAQQALDDWLAMLKGAEADAPWFDEVRGRAVELSQAADIDIADRLPPPRGTSLGETVGNSGPSAQDMAQAAQLPVDDRQAMIDGMVARLDARLKENPKDLEGWTKLIRARRVLGQEGLALQALADGRAAFVGDKKALADLERASKESLALPPT